MQGWKIFTHSMGMVFNNLGAALRISLLLYLVQTVVSVYYTVRFAGYLQGISKGTVTAVPQGAIGTGLLVLVVSIFVPIWIAVSWHRYILLEENPETVIPPFRGPQIMAYLGKSILIGLLIMIVGVIIGTIVSLVLGSVLGSLGAMVGIFLMIGVMMYLFYRVGLTLPAAALGKPLKFGESMNATDTAKTVVFHLALIAIGFAVLIQIPGFFNVNPASIVNIVYSHVVGWIAMMVGISVLTTLYGVYVEGRDL